MPIYAYECPQCGELRELVRKIDERDMPAYCPSCTTNDDPVVMDRLIGNAGFILKGSCWARDGYSTHLGDHPDYKAGRWNGSIED